ncbi:MAG: DUF1697 domain-containing protein [Blastocatellia bacterium]
MPKYIAFLRAVNVGGRVVKMETLRERLAAAGFTSVETFIASGNVIFDAGVKTTQKLEKQIEALLRDWLGYEVETMIRTVPELAAIAEYPAFSPEQMTEALTLHVGFLSVTPPADAAEKLGALCTQADDFHLHGRELYWLVRGKFTDSLVKPNAIDKALGKTPVTFRNLTTVRKLLAKYGG